MLDGDRVHRLSLLTLLEASKILRRSRWSLYGDVKKGRLPAVRIGRNLCFRPQDIEAFIAANTTTAAMPRGAVAETGEKRAIESKVGGSRLGHESGLWIARRGLAGMLKTL
jgi:excisionase family DNA binding protein